MSNHFVPPSSPSSPAPHETHYMLQDPPTSPSTSPTPRPARTATQSSGHQSAVLSPLNPASATSATSATFPIPRSRPASRGSQYLTNRFASEHSANPNTNSYYNASDSAYPSFAAPTTAFGAGGQRGSMVLYRLADDMLSPGGVRDSTARDSTLLPPDRKFARESVWSSSGDSFVSISSDRDSKYPGDLMSPFASTPRGLVPYAYDPASDELEPPDEEDMLHDPNNKTWGTAGGRHPMKKSFPWRGLINVAVLILLILALLCLFIFYPVLDFFRNDARNTAIDGNIRINATGQAPVLFQMPELIDRDTPDSAKTRRGFDGHDYELVFSDEFNVEGRTFYPGDDPFWEAVDIWYGVTGDLEWYDPQQVITRDGHLVITMDSTETLVAGQTPGSTAPFTMAENHNMQYRSGMLQSWNKFCFTSGYIEVRVVLPGPDENAAGYWPGAWTMGNLGRPGYPGSTDGTWPYTYNECDVGTFPNQTLRDKSGPAAALHSDASRSVNNFELSWLSGQRLSACTCPGEDHPGPVHNRGRGAPEIDIFEASADKQNPTGATVSQSAQFAPFTHDYLYNNGSGEWEQLNTVITRPNRFRGSAVQQSVSGVSILPSDMFQGSGRNFKTLGFEYWANPSNVQEGFITWQVDDQLTHRMHAAAVGPDQDPITGSGVGQRLIPEEPMSIILNNGFSNNWQTIRPETLIFPAEMLIDYVRVYQRRGSQNVGCSPPDYPTADYINSHPEAYSNPNLTTWPYPKPRNVLWEGSC
ncbi:hypothetical protein ONZ45_g12486 [Pleurotus djamor]|nr:hypothetical protein ONZ45_g12486 [Pleurotus djamor]